MILLKNHKLCLETKFHGESPRNVESHTGTEVRGRRAYLFKYKFLVIAMQGKFGQKVFGITLEVINQCILAL